MRYAVGDSIYLGSEQVVVENRRILFTSSGRLEYYEFSSCGEQKYGMTLRELDLNRATLAHAAPTKRRMN